MKAIDGLTGKLLLAMPDMGDPRFAGSVVFMCEHSDDGAMGLIANKPVPDVSFGHLLDQMQIPRTPQARDVAIRYGGPVERQRGFVLHGDDYRTDSSTAGVSADLRLTATRDVLEDLAGGRGPAQCLLALGYAGWAPGQLEQEIAHNGWLVADASPGLLFGPPETMWTTALRSLGIDPLLLSAVGGQA